MRFFKPKIKYVTAQECRNLREFDEQTDPRELYDELLLKGQLGNQREKILRILKDCKPHYCFEFLAEGISQYNARIKELRDMGARIISKRDSDGHPYFILEI